jgi:lipoprotein LprG
MPRASRTWAALAAAAVVLLAGCTKNSSAGSSVALPDGGQLLVASATAMKDVKTAHFTLDVAGQPAGIPVHHAEGSLTREGNAKGSATLEQLGATVELQFVIVDKKLYLKGPTGGFQQIPAALASTVYDPSAILDPDRGVSKLLGTIKDAKTEAKESVDGKDAYRVAITPTPGSLDALIPGVGDKVTGKLWLAADSKRVLKGVFTVPANGSDKGGTITITFTDYDAPVTISAP